jgi:phage tail sheath protein FI
MGEYLSPGLFLEERSASAGAIAGVSTSTYATCGWLRKGPENEAQLVTSFDNFVETFGTYWRNSYIPFMMAAFFQNEGARAYVTRVVPSDATVGSNASCFDSAATVATFIGRALPATTDLSTNPNFGLKIDGGAAADIDASAGAAVPGAVTPAEMQAAIDLTVGITCTLETGDRLKIVHDTAGAGKSLEFLEASANDNTAKILGLDVSGSKTYLYEGEDAVDWTAESPWKGAYYNQVRMCIAGNDDFLDDYGGWTKFNVTNQDESAVGEADWSDLESYEAVVLDDDTDEHFIEDVVNDQTNFCKIEKGATYGIPQALKAHQILAEWIGEGDALEVTFTGTLLNPVVHLGTLSIVAAGITATDDGDGNLTGTGVSAGTIDYDTGAFSITFSAAPAADVQILATYYQEATATEVCCQLSGGTDGTGPLTRGDVTDPALAASKAGLYAFDDLDEILNISMPDFAGDVTVSNDLIAYGEQYKNRFAILTTQVGVTPQNAKKFVQFTAQYNTSYAALYYPWVTIYDPITDDGRGLNVPPDGFVAGVFSRTDTNRNVGKAPAGINDGKINGAIGLERILNKGERDILYPVRINCLVSSPQTGRCVLGARTLSKDAEWLYVNIRRLFMFCEQSVYNASFWVLFENNGPGLWAKIKAQGDGFFNNIFRDGYLAGTKPSEAWHIKVDSENNPQSAIDAGLLTVDYYIAGNKPAEFVRLRFQQKVNQ